jgi:hypothetical protein
VNRTLLSRPSAFIPIGMSTLALMILVVYGLLFGLTREPDEGTAAHLWQLLMAGQLPFVAFFAVRWLPTRPLQAAQVVALQVVAALAAMAPVWWFHL